MVGLYGVQASMIYPLFLMLSFIAILAIIFDGNYNTEQVCFNSEGKVLFYEKGFRPGRAPYIKLTKRIYKHRHSELKLIATCRTHWGNTKGRDYWEGK